MIIKPKAIFKPKLNRKLSVFRIFCIIGKNLRVETGVMNDAELTDESALKSNQSLPVLSGSNRF